MTYMSESSFDQCEKRLSCGVCTVTGKICPHISNTANDHKYQETLQQYLKQYYTPEVCKKCSNHPSNGGSGICNCTAPLVNLSTTTSI